MSKPRQKNLGSIATILSGFAFNSARFGNEGDFPIVRIRDVVRGFSETYYSGEYSDVFVVGNGDLLIGMDGEFNTARWRGGPALLNQRVCKVIPDSKILDKDYLYYRLPRELKKIEDSTSYVTVKHLSVKALQAIEIPLPPLDEQRRIAAILDKADAIRSKRQESIRLTEEFLRSTFLEMFGDPMSNPKRWEKVTIGDLVSEVTYGTSEKASYVGKYPILRMNNITYEGEWDFSDLKRIDMPDKDLSKHFVHKGDILFNRTNSKELVGKTAVYRLNDPMAYAGYLIKLKPNQHSNSEYIAAYLNSKHGKLILEGMCKSIIGMANINARELQSIEILKPPLKLQEEYAKLVCAVEESRARLKEASYQNGILFNSLSHLAFRGELATH